MRYVKDGMTWGEPVPGSRLFRCWCEACGEPMRDTWLGLWLGDDGEARRPHYCETCSPKHAGCSSPPSPNDGDANGLSRQAAFSDG